MEKDIVISLNKVAVSYRDEIALRDVTLKIKQGELVGIAGPNGAGKTTLLTAINGLATLVHGEVKVLGYKMSAGKKEEIFALTGR